MTLALTINGRPRTLSIAPRVSLADALRDAGGLTGTHLGCEHGVCGACTVLLDGQPARSCITFAVACAGAEVTTIEGFDDDELAGELRAAFRRHHALQCGYCTPGMMVSARDLALRLPLADEKAIRIGLSGNLCRCTGYVGIVNAVKDVIEARRLQGVAAIAGAGRTTLGPVGAHFGYDAAGDPAAPATKSASPNGGAGDDAQTDMPPADFMPTHTFEHSFAVSATPERVFAHFADVRTVGAAIPGLTISSANSDRAEGRFAVALGPITARFQGRAALSRDAARLSGRILAAGGDGASQSRARGAIEYQVRANEAGSGSVVALHVGYSLSGLLAQLGRSGLIEAVAKRLIADFALNLERQLGGDASAVPALETRLPLLAALAAVLRLWATQLLARFGKARQ
jgi:carbon-monoxide dehydrogenase small subunit